MHLHTASTGFRSQVQEPATNGCVPLDLLIAGWRACRGRSEILTANYWHRDLPADGLRRDEYCMFRAQQLPCCSLLDLSVALELLVEPLSVKSPQRRVIAPFSLRCMLLLKIVRWTILDIRALRTNAPRPRSHSE